ncbi:MAG: glycosyltransferase family 2 protein [Lachnospiraceae bacterium]|nr:glycosyltransferase family 2 protein [Lachnospiraceae bacterium]
MNNIVVSVVMPAYCCRNTIRKAVESVFAQEMGSLGEVELIIVDDCSPEPFQDVIADYLKDSRLIYIRNEKNQGVAASRNRGIAVAKGRYIAFLDSDDWWLPGKLKCQLERLRTDQTVLCSTGRQLRTFEGKDMGRYIPVKEYVTYRDLLTHNSIACSSVMVRKDVIEEFPMEHDECHEDYITWLLILRKYGKASGINQPYLQYRMSKNSKSGNKLKSAKMTFLVYRHMGYGLVKSCLCFCSYAIHGVKKYMG